MHRNYRFFFALCLSVLCALSACSAAAPDISDDDMRLILRQKIADAVQGKGAELGPVVAYRVFAYDKVRREVTVLRRISHEHQSAVHTVGITKRVVFMNPEDAEKMEAGEPSSVIGFFDPDFDCFVCMKYAPDATSGRRSKNCGKNGRKNLSEH